MDNSRFKNTTKNQYDITLVKKIGTNENIKYKLVRMNYLKTKGIEEFEDWEKCLLPKSKKGEVNNIKLFENISRAKRNIQELAFCNEWQWFFTGTLNDKKYNREDLEKFHKDFTLFLRNYKSNNHLENKIDFVVVPELHSDGKSWHMHGLINGLPKEHLTKFVYGMTMSKQILEKVKNNEDVYKWQAYENKFGFCDFEPIRNQEAISKYITKYINKELGTCVKDLGAHLYYHSRGLNKAEVIKKGHMNWYFENKFIQPKIYNGDYCSILELSQEEFENLNISSRFFD